MKIQIERQDDLVVCKVKPSDKWLFTACYRGTAELLKFDFPPGSKFEFDLEAKNIKEITTERSK
jgi:hypothetical protein